MPHILSVVFVLLMGWMVATPAVEPDISTIKQQVAKALPPGISIDAIRPSAIPGLYEVELDAQIVYVTSDGKYLLLGDILDLNTRSNLSEAWRERAAARLIDAMGEQNMIVMGPDKPKHTITVFTDVDCPYCAKLHLEAPELVRHGVRVRYLLYPRSGIKTETYRRSVAVWCAADRVKAVGVAKAGGKLDMKTCTNPVEAHYALGRRLGVDGTPTIFLEDGRKLHGYLPSDRLLALLGINAEPQKSDAR